MPPFLLPRASTPHRLAAIALYRALLTQCRALPTQTLEPSQRLALQNIIRNRFRQARHTHSDRWLTINFEAGYEGLDHLDAAVAGDEGRRGMILELLERAPQKVKEEPKTVYTKKQMKMFRQRDRKDGDVVAAAASPPPKRGISIFDRPLPLEKLSGRRHVPVLFNAQGLPVLRLKKPQPQNLSAYINDKLKKKSKLHDTRHRLDIELDLAYMEDKWDAIISRVGGVGQGGDMGEAMREPRWHDEVKMARQETFDKMTRQKEKNLEMVARMQGVVQREREMFEREREERRIKREALKEGREMGEKQEV